VLFEVAFRCGTFGRSCKCLWYSVLDVE